MIDPIQAMKWPTMEQVKLGIRVEAYQALEGWYTYLPQPKTQLEREILEMIREVLHRREVNAKRSV